MQVLKTSKNCFKAQSVFEGALLFYQITSIAFQTLRLCFYVLRGLVYYHEMHHQITGLLSVTLLKIVVFWNSFSMFKPENMFLSFQENIIIPPMRKWRSGTSKRPKFDSEIYKNDLETKLEIKRLLRISNSKKLTYASLEIIQDIVSFATSCPSCSSHDPPGH